MAHAPTHKLTNSFEGALAGGGDPATSPLYVFGPFLKLIVVGGVASITFGATVWLVVFTIAMVSAMYRLVMGWVTDGSGGSGLSEEEFGRWAVKVNASITFIEYTLTFLVSMAALVTFIADRIPLLNEAVLGIQYRTLVALVLSVVIGWIVNRGPKVAARAFGPATAGVLLLLWVMVFASLARFGFRLPSFDLRAFAPENLHYTFGGFTRILAVMTGIEVFANLVAAYEGPPAEKSRKAFGSLLIVMGTAAVTMLIVGPTIFDLSDPTNPTVSVFTQTMDALLPAPLPYIGTLIGIAVLMSACAASAQGLQNLSLGLRERHYIPAFLGERNRFDVADKPVWVEVGVSCVLFLILGTHEETYLAIYAAGVFILLSMTGWAAAKRLLRMLGEEFSLGHLALLVGTALAALLTSGATVLIFAERFFEGAWTYLVFIPILYAFFSYFRNTLGAPSPAREQIGEIIGGMLGGFGIGQALRGKAPPRPVPARSTPTNWQPAPALAERLCSEPIAPHHLLIPLDGSTFAERAVPLATVLCQAYHADLTLVSARPEKEEYLKTMARQLSSINGFSVATATGTDSVVETTQQKVAELGVDLVVTSTLGGSGVPHWLSEGVATKIVRGIDTPVLLVQQAGKEARPRIKRLLVNLDGSENAEHILPYARALATAFSAEVLLLSVPEVPDAAKFGVAPDQVEKLRGEAETRLWHYLADVATAIRNDCYQIQTMVTGTSPVRTIVRLADSEDVDIIMMTTRGRGGLDRLFLGSVAMRVVEQTSLPVFLVPIGANHNTN